MKEDFPFIKGFLWCDDCHRAHSQYDICDKLSKKISPEGVKRDLKTDLEYVRAKSRQHSIMEFQGE